MKSIYSISAVVAIYNEAAALKKNIPKINSFLTKHFKDYEILIIESGSTDGSYEISEKLTKHFRNVKVIHEKQRKGWGSGFKIGISKASKQLIWPLDLDIPFPLNSLLKALNYIDSYDCILSYRSKDSRSLNRKIASFFYNTIIRRSLGVNFRHINSNFRLFKSKSLKELELNSNSWFIEAELAYKIKKADLKCFEFPVPLIDRTIGKSKVGIKTTLKLLQELLEFKHSLNK